VKEWGIAGLPYPPLISVNAANMEKAGRLFGAIPHLKCYAHTINLAVQKVLKIKKVSHILAKVRRVVSYFHHSSIATAMLKSKSELLGIPNHKLIGDVLTRWNSAFDMLQRYLEMDCAIVAALRSDELKKAKDIFTLDPLDDSDIRVAQTVKDFLQPIKQITTALSAEQLPTASMIMQLQRRLMDVILSTSSNDSKLVADMKETMANDLRMRYDKDEDFLLIFSAMDPRFKDLPFLCNGRKNEVFDRVKAECIHLHDQNTPTVPPTESKTSEEQFLIKKSKNVKLNEIFGEEYRSEVTGTTIDEEICDEIKQYRKVEHLPLDGNILQWWKTNEFRFPKLALFAKSQLMVPATSVPVERIFSTAGDIVTAQRSCLKPKSVDMFIFLKTNM
jgi:hypothetical protein